MAYLILPECVSDANRFDLQEITWYKSDGRSETEYIRTEMGTAHRVAVPTQLPPTSSARFPRAMKILGLHRLDTRQKRLEARVGDRKLDLPIDDEFLPNLTLLTGVSVDEY